MVEEGGKMAINVIHYMKYPDCLYDYSQIGVGLNVVTLGLGVELNGRQFLLSVGLLLLLSS